MRNKMEKGRGSVRLKFWQKTYLLTLALFLLALGGGITAIASVSQQRAFEAECGKLLAQQHSVAQSLAADAAAVQARRPEALPRLAQNYAGQLKRSGVWRRRATYGRMSCRSRIPRCLRCRPRDSACIRYCCPAGGMCCISPPCCPPRRRM